MFTNPVRGHADVTSAQKKKRRKRCCDFLFQVRLRHESSAEQVALQDRQTDRNLSVGLASFTG